MKIFPHRAKGQAMRFFRACLVWFIILSLNSSFAYPVLAQSILPNTSSDIPLISKPFSTSGGEYQITQNFADLVDDRVLELVKSLESQFASSSSILNTATQEAVLGISTSQQSASVVSETNLPKYHNGIDFAMPIGTQVSAVDEGVVTVADMGDYGLTVIVKHAWGESLYGHLSEVKVSVGQNVSKGDIVALSGTTGMSTGPHLHFGIKPNNPNLSNDYFGFVDPAQYLGISSSSKSSVSFEDVSANPDYLFNYKYDIGGGVSAHFWDKEQKKPGFAIADSDYNYKLRFFLKGETSQTVASASGSIIEFPVRVSGTDATLRYSLSELKVKEDLILPNKPEMSSVEDWTVNFQMQSVGLEIAKEGSEYVLKSKDGSTYWKLLEPTIVDAVDNKGKISFEIVENKEAADCLLPEANCSVSDLQLKVDREFLETAVYPVTIDPTVVVSGGIVEADTQFGGLQKKIVYANSNWYAFYNDAGQIQYKKSADGLTWGSAVNVDSSDSDNYNPSIWLEGNSIYTAWIDDGSEAIEINTINTASADALGTKCTSASQGTIGSTFSVSTAVADNGTVYLAYSDTGADTEAAVLKLVFSGCTFTDITTVAAATSATSPGTSANDASVGTNAWTNPGNATASDNVYATNATSGTSQALKATNYGFNIPTNATILGVTAEIERKATTGSSSTTLSYTGAEQTYVVPAGVTSITVDAQGGGGYWGAAGLGGRVQTTLAVTPGETLYLYVGARPAAISGGGGWPNGGTGGSSSFNSGMGGSGSSDIRQGGSALANRVIVAGGGGGGGTNSNNLIGGNGGGTTGATAGNPSTYPGATGGGGGTPSSGGGAGSGSGLGSPAGQNGTVGALSTGGNGGNGGGTDSNFSGGGGGGGYYGGGGGGGGNNGGAGGTAEGASGGGGSSYAGTGTSSTTHTQGYRNGHGQVILTYDTNVTDNRISLVKADGTISATNKSAGAVWPAADAYASFGGAADLWGETWTPADINDADFGAVALATVGSGATASVDHVRITVAYSTASSLTAGDRPIITTTSNNANLVFQDGNLSHSVYDGTSWTTTNTTIAAVTDSVFDTTTDGTNIWALSVSGTTATNLYKYNGSSWSTLTAPWSGQTNLTSSAIAYDSTNTKLYAMVIKDASEQAYFKSTDATTISWSSESSFGFTAGDLGNISVPLSGAGALQIGAVVRQGSNFEFSMLNQNPSTPTSLGPTSLVNGSAGSDNTPTLTFTLADTDGADTVKYQIQIDDTSNFSSPVVDYTSALAAQGARTFTVGQAAGSGTYTTGSAGQTLSDTSYYWRVKAIDNSAAESSYATANSGSVAFVIDTTAPAVPPDPAVSVLSTNSRQVRLIWSLISGAATYNVYRSQTNSATGFTLVGSPTESGHIDNIQKDITYWFYLTSVDSVGNESAASRVVEITSFTGNSSSSTSSSSSSSSSTTTSTAAAVVSTIETIISNIFNPPAEETTQAINPLTGRPFSFSSALAKVPEVVERVAEVARSWFDNFFGDVGNVFGQALAFLPGSVEDFVLAVAHNIAGFFSGAKNSIILAFAILTGQGQNEISDVSIAYNSKTSVTISWKTKHAANSKVNYGFDTSYGLEEQSGNLTKDHELTLKNLEEGKTYYFEVMSQGADYVYDAYYTFTTPEK